MNNKLKEIVMNHNFDMTLIITALLAIVLLPYAVFDFFSGTSLWAFWKIVGGTFGITLALVAVLEYKLNKG
jgi:uncharacterized membrane protein